MKRYNITYPKLSDHYLYETQQGIKDFIKKFDECMIDSGLVRAPDTGQLDVNNIPDQDLTKFKLTPQIYRDDENSLLRYLPLIYCFSDTLQATSPVYILIRFELGKLLNTQNADKYPIGLFTQILISNKTNGNSVITQGLEFYVGALGYHNSPSITDMKLATDYGNLDSIINYDREKGLLVLNVLPRFRFTPEPASNMHFATNSPGINRSLVDVIVYRVNDQTIGALGFSWMKQTNQNGVIPIPNKEFKFKNADINYIDTACQSVQGMYSSVQTYVNGKIVTSPLTSYDPLKKLMVRNPVILLTSKQDTGMISGGTLNVIISDTEKHKYMIYSPVGENFKFNDSDVMNLLIYDGKVE